MAVTARSVKSDGKRQRRGSQAAKAHTPNLDAYYRVKLPDIHPGDYEFELTLIRPQQPSMVLRTVEQLSWDDESSSLSGSVTLHRPVVGDPTSLPIAKGHMIRCRVRWGKEGVFEPWTMRCGAPQAQVDANTVTVPLHDEMVFLQAGTEDWVFRKTKHRPQGWTATEITLEVARRRGLAVKLPLPPCTRRFALVKRSASAFQVLVAAWGEEKKSSGKPLLLRLVNGELEIAGLKRNRTMYVLKREIETALIVNQQGDRIPFTILEGAAKLGTGKGAKKITYTATDAQAVRALGNVRHRKDYGTVSSHDELVRFVKRDLAASLRVQKKVTIQHRGIPFIRRGDGLRVEIPKEGYEGTTSFVWVSRINHTVSSGTYTMDMDLVNRDLFLAAQKAAQQAQKGAASSGGGGGSGPRWLVPASAEDDPPGTTAACGPLPADGRGYSVLSASGTSSDAGTAGQALSVGSVWPCGVDLVITNPANNKSVTVPHVDNGAGSDSILPVVGIYPTTRADLGLDNSGSYQVIIQAADGRALRPARGHQV